MSRILFNSTLAEKQELLSRLSTAYEDTQSPSVLDAIRVVEDSIILHQVHGVLNSLCGDLDKISHYTNCKDTYRKLNRSVLDVNSFYEKIKRKIKKNKTIR
jgi:hypothetical protein